MFNVSVLINVTKFFLYLFLAKLLLPFLSVDSILGGMKGEFCNKPLQNFFFYFFK